MTITEFLRDPSQLVLINNEYYRRDEDQPHKLNKVPVQKSLLTSKFGMTNRQLEDVLELTGRVNEPQHIGYQSIINNKWNMYHRVNWQPVEGEWPTIAKLINHIYGKNVAERDQTEELYDYHTIMIRQPKQKLFGRVLYSHVQGTSKSAMAYLEQLMFEDNYTNVRDSELESDFNSGWAESLLIHMDEPAFRYPKKMARNIRDMITMKQVKIRRMREEHALIPFHGKILITSNDTDFMPFEVSDRRYWIREVPKFPIEDQDPHFENKMARELPHYIHFLLNREMKCDTSRGVFWLPQTVIKTNGFAKLVGDNIVSEQETLQDYFENLFWRTDHEEVWFTSKDLVSTVQWETKTPPTGQYIAKLLRDKMGFVQPTKVSKLGNRQYITVDAPATGRLWRARRSDFVIDTDLFSDVKA